ncbi:hypothetical protein, variant [Blastomyces dermatitidis ER-3]|uniref:Uncharacterized protein n=1 Tax=Ajellomyces dermatitidis (strain ER-3 / ATCC MYA-2586) TaxID=559297 RepID=A0ABX2VZB4_AJEDR|nr:uncharacterized protein BDCG_07568 [Blastomyces dermatitidis ER-3]XP_045282209.1 hypothetical protein, variant [Blastomyces dermatitidis ER-3]OAT02481.1 hypothetical protein BDCG_07568 [Blastomyces dermatitidis ER-3]OAT02482.1 hypothetical protein, variant [Blastomyces dermatitidis ER-3]
MIACVFQHLLLNDVPSNDVLLVNLLLFWNGLFPQSFLSLYLSQDRPVLVSQVIFRHSREIARQCPDTIVAKGCRRVCFRYKMWTSLIDNLKHSLEYFTFSQKDHCASIRGQKQLGLFCEHRHVRPRHRPRRSHPVRFYDHNNNSRVTIPIDAQCVAYILPLLTGGGWHNLTSIKLCGVRPEDMIDRLPVLYKGLDDAE